MQVIALPTTKELTFTGFLRLNNNSNNNNTAKPQTSETLDVALYETRNHVHIYNVTHIASSIVKFPSFGEGHNASSPMIIKSIPRLSAGLRGLPQTATSSAWTDWCMGAAGIPTDCMRQRAAKLFLPGAKC